MACRSLGAWSAESGASAVWTAAVSGRRLKMPHPADVTETQPMAPKTVVTESYKVVSKDKDPRGREGAGPNPRRPGRPSENSMLGFRPGPGLYVCVCARVCVCTCACVHCAPVCVGGCCVSEDQHEVVTPQCHSEAAPTDEVQALRTFQLCHSRALRTFRGPSKDTHLHTKPDAGVSWLPFLPFQAVHPGATLAQSTVVGTVGQHFGLGWCLSPQPQPHTPQPLGPGGLALQLLPQPRASLGCLPLGVEGPVSRAQESLAHVLESSVLRQGWPLGGQWRSGHPSLLGPVALSPLPTHTAQDPCPYRPSGEANLSLVPRPSVWPLQRGGAPSR